MFSRRDLYGRVIGGLKTGLSFTFVSLRPNLARATTVGASRNKWRDQVIGWGAFLPFVNGIFRLAWGFGCVNLQMAHSLNRLYDLGDVTTYNAASSGDAWVLFGASAADSVIASSTGQNVAFFATVLTAEECRDARRT